MGIPTFETGIYNGTDWEVLTAAEASIHGVTQTCPATIEPVNKSGFYWKNTATTSIGGVKAGDTVVFDTELGIWVSINKKDLYSFLIGPISLRPAAPREGDVFLAYTGLGFAYLYLAVSGVWSSAGEQFSVTAAAATNEVSTTIPKKATDAATLVKRLVLAKALPSTPPTTKAISQVMPTIYRRNKTTDVWKPNSPYAVKTMATTTIPAKP